MLVTYVLSHNIVFIFLLMFYLKNTIINYIKTIEIFKKIKKRENIKMRIKKIKDNFYEELGMSKYDFFNNLVNEIGNFAFLISEIYKSGEVKTSIIENYGYYISNESSLYIAELNEAKEIRVYYSYEELFFIYII